MSTPGNPLQPGQVPGTVNVGDVASQEIDPKIMSELWHLGTDASGRIPKWIVMIVAGFIQCIKMAIAIWATIIDAFMTALADFFQAAQGNSNPSFYSLVAALLTDLTGIEVNGGALIQTFQQRGRLAAMQSLGGSLVDALASEFAGVFQADKGGVFTTARGSGIGGLPVVDLSPEQGLNAARSFMGFALSFTVREGNTDFFAESIPFGLGHAFKSITEDMSKNLGLGRLVRLALKPLFQNLLGVPMTWALNKQYRPTLLGPAEIVRGNISKLVTFDDMAEQLARHGYSQTRIDTLSNLHTKWPGTRELFLLELLNLQDPVSTDTFLSYLGYSGKGIEILRFAERHDLSRKLSFEVAHRLIVEVGKGIIDLPTFQSALDTMPLWDEERQDFLKLATALLVHPRKRLTFAQMTQAFVDGIVAVDEVAAFLTEEGYRTDDIAILLQLDLFKLKAAAAKAAAAAAKAKKSGSSGSSTGTTT